MVINKKKDLNEVIEFIKKGSLESAKSILLNIKEKNRDSLFYNLLGYVEQHLGFFGNAKKNYLTSLSIDENNYDAKLNLAILHYKLREFLDSETLFNFLIKKNPKDSNLYYNLGIVKYDQGQYDRSIECFKSACEINPNFYFSYHHLAQSYEAAQNYDLAISYYEKANTLNSEGLAMSCNNLGNIYLTKKDYIKSESYFKKALELAGDKSITFNNLGTLYFEVGELDSSFECFEKAISIDKYNTRFYSNFLSIIPFFKKDLNFYKDHAKKYRESIKTIDNNLLDPLVIGKDFKNKKIKLGFLSSDFRAHPTGYFLLDMMREIYKRNNIELYAFSDSNFKDSYTRELKSYFHSWHEVDSLEDIKLINIIRNLGINILVDMQGHTYGNRLQIFAYKAAPVQISWASYLASTGIKEIDYVIGDNTVTPVDDKKYYVEKIFCLPKIWCSLSTSDIFSINPSSLPALKNGFITFGCFNNVFKINDDVINVWSQILNKVPSSKLFIKSNRFRNQYFLNKFYDKFKKNNISEERLILETDSSREKLLFDYNKIDIALDTFPYTGGTTGLELSWMCVPLLTKRGDSFISRCGESINLNLNMKEWIADDNEDYINKAIEYTQDFDKLNKIKLNLIKTSRKSIIFDSNLFSKQFEDAINEIWRIYLQENN